MTSVITGLYSRIAGDNYHRHPDHIASLAGIPVEKLIEIAKSLSTEAQKKFDEGNTEAKTLEGRITAGITKEEAPAVTEATIKIRDTHLLYLQGAKYMLDQIVTRLNSLVAHRLSEADLPISREEPSFSLFLEARQKAEQALPEVTQYLATVHTTFYDPFVVKLNALAASLLGRGYIINPTVRDLKTTSPAEVDKELVALQKSRDAHALNYYGSKSAEEGASMMREDLSLFEKGAPNLTLAQKWNALHCAIKEHRTCNELDRKMALAKAINTLSIDFPTLVLEKYTTSKKDFLEEIKKTTEKTVAEVEKASAVLSYNRFKDENPPIDRLTISRLRLIRIGAADAGDNGVVEAIKKEYGSRPDSAKKDFATTVVLRT